MLKKVLMTNKEVEEVIEFQDRCGCNTLLQQILSTKSEVRIYKLINNITQEIEDYIMEE
jgi:hypothetical protein